ncbi:hypothetical protein SBOR_7398 [Sclerotinia borealis F-4128]|uniref:Uncharacterized protein n=1 Tax=Sclerotinia borealis (strain F-4128) TaxID=1432307 RepID=W9C8M9_SCLBF|nr:hypothetical protein SBOR_7398 [Sclerotinia borealis F-4128]
MTMTQPSSPTSNFSIQPCTHSDLPGMLSVYKSAFQTDPFRLARWPESQVPHSVFDTWLTNIFTKYLTTPHTQCWKVVEASTGHIAGWTHWAEPHTMSDEETAQGKREDEQEEREGKERGEPEGRFPVGSVMHVCEAKVEGWDDLRERWYRKEDMYFIHFLSISLSHQNLGLGSLLLTAITQVADANTDTTAQQKPYPIYLEATVAGYPVYVKHGFVEKGVMEVDLGFYGVGRNWAMVRGVRIVRGRVVGEEMRGEERRRGGYSD